MLFCSEIIVTLHAHLQASLNFQKKAKTLKEKVITKTHTTQCYSRHFMWKKKRWSLSESRSHQSYLADIRVELSLLLAVSQLEWVPFESELLHRLFVGLPCRASEKRSEHVERAVHWNFADSTQMENTLYVLSMRSVSIDPHVLLVLSNKEVGKEKDSISNFGYIAGYVWKFSRFNVSLRWKFFRLYFLAGEKTNCDQVKYKISVFKFKQ